MLNLIAAAVGLAGVAGILLLLYGIMAGLTYPWPNTSLPITAGLILIALSFVASVVLKVQEWFGKKKEQP